MSNTDPANDVWAARNKANSDSNNGALPANTGNWAPWAKDAYENQMKQNQEQQKSK